MINKCPYITNFNEALRVAYKTPKFYENAQSNDARLYERLAMDLLLGRITTMVLQITFLYIVGSGGMDVESFIEVTLLIQGGSLLHYLFLKNIYDGAVQHVLAQDREEANFTEGNDSIKMTVFHERA
jgi:hypothetical protein